MTSWNKEILSAYLEQNINPFTSLEEDVANWRLEIQKAREAVRAHLEKYTKQLEALQLQSREIAESTDRVLDQVARSTENKGQEKDLGKDLGKDLRDLQLDVYNLCLEMKAYRLPKDNVAT